MKCFIMVHTGMMVISMAENNTKSVSVTKNAFFVTDLSSIIHIKRVNGRKLNVHTFDIVIVYQTVA